jgi:hypothetical protein
VGLEDCRRILQGLFVSGGAFAGSMQRRWQGDLMGSLDRGNGEM